MDIKELLEEYVDNNKDVTFPIYHDDSSNLLSTFTPYGFSADGMIFTKHWALNFSAITRLTACFTGVLYINSDVSTGHYFVLLKSFVVRPIDRINGLPDWYPMPEYAKYGPFLESNINDIIFDLYTDDEVRIRALTNGDSDYIESRLEQNNNRVVSLEATYTAQLREQGTTPDSDPDVVIKQAFRAVKDGTLNSGVPIGAEEILIRSEEEIIFSLHPSDSNNEYVPGLTYNPHFYFHKWRTRIGNDRDYGVFPSVFRDQVLAPPLTTGNVFYVKQSAADGFTPLYASLYDAYGAANENDIILILDKSIYSLNVIDKFISVQALLSGGDLRDIRTLDEEDSFFNIEHPEWFVNGSLARSLRRNFPIIKSQTNGKRGINITYQQGEPSSNGIIFLENIAVFDNNLSVSTTTGPTNDLIYSRGGAGILINGDYYDSGGTAPLGNDFSQVHLNNCGIIHNYMTNYPRNNLTQYFGGGILCWGSSPLISKCLIKGNFSYHHGGGICAFKYSWPTIIENYISHNVTLGTQIANTEDSAIGDDGDGGGIGIFQAHPTNMEEIERELGVWDAIDGTIQRRLPHAWVENELSNAKTKWVHIHKNKIHNNTAEMSGGGVYGTVLAQLSMYDNEIYDNQTNREDGGGIAVTFGSSLKIDGTAHPNNRIENNHAARYGGGIYLRSSEATVKNMLISSNELGHSTQLGGGGIALLSRPEMLLKTILPVFDIIQHLIFAHIDKVELIIENSLIQNNSAQKGGGILLLSETVGYQIFPRAHGISLGLIGILPIHLRLEHASDVSSNVTDNIIAERNDSLIFGNTTVPLRYADAPTNSIIDLTYA